MIQPGLQRITKLLVQTPLRWRAVHVAGTNGKGSTCVYVNAMLRAYNKSPILKMLGHKPLKYGRFTSPHLIDRWDCIRINDEVIPKQDFLDIESQFMNSNKHNNIGASEFEVLTATAFEAFNRASVDIGIVEVGMGGREDATNVIGLQESEGPARPKPLVTAITSIALDHQGFLGDTINEIASHKAGIMKPGVPVTFEHDWDDRGYLPTLEKHARNIGAPVLDDWTHTRRTLGGRDFQRLLNQKLEDIRSDGGGYWNSAANVDNALAATFSVLEQLGRIKRPDEFSDTDYAEHLADLLAEMSYVHWRTVFPGRYETLLWDTRGLPLPYGGPRALLLDGAHNKAAAEQLNAYLDRDNRNPKVTWIIACSQGRPLIDFMTPLFRPGDMVIATEFGPVDGMPWVKPVPAKDIFDHAHSLLGTSASYISSARNVKTALQEAHVVSRDRLIVVTGSLYLMGDVHRLFRNGTLRRAAIPPSEANQSEQFLEPYGEA